MAHDDQIEIFLTEGYTSSEERLSGQHVLDTIVRKVDPKFQRLCNGLKWREAWSEDR